MQSKDQRRIVGPDKVVPYSFFLSHDTKSLEMRSDGRIPVKLQNMFMAVNVISQASGSSFIEFGNTKVVCGIYGPREVQRMSEVKLKGQVSCEVRYAPFSARVRKSPQPDRSQKEMSRQLKEAIESVIILDKYPKAQIDVNVSVIEDGGSVFSACLTAAGLALAHSNIDAYDVLVGADVVWSDGVCYVNPSLDEERLVSANRLRGRPGHASLTLGMMPKYSQGQIALLVHEGELQTHDLADGVTLAIEACQSVFKLVQQVLLAEVEQVIKKDLPPEG